MKEGKKLYIVDGNDFAKSILKILIKAIFVFQIQKCLLEKLKLKSEERQSNTKKSYFHCT